MRWKVNFKSPGYVANETHIKERENKVDLFFIDGISGKKEREVFNCQLKFEGKLLKVFVNHG